MIKTLFTPKDGARQPLPPVETVGGKGRGLYWLARHRFPVPLTWVLSTYAFDLAVRHIGLTESVAAIEGTIAHPFDDWAAIQQAMDDLEPHRARVVEALERMETMAHVTATLADLPREQGQWAVRSSATVEDDVRHSFAGQFLSILSVPREDLWGAICRVWASNYRRDALLYCAQNRAAMPRMAVILQPMAPITAQDRSGVAFSHSPVPALPGVLIQASFGSGQVVVGGYGGDLFSVQGAEVRVEAMPPNHIRISGQGGDTTPAPPPVGLALTEDEARELADLVRAVADKWGRPVNIEFVWRAGKGPTLVQVRSIVER